MYTRSILSNEFLGAILSNFGKKSLQKGHHEAQKRINTLLYGLMLSRRLFLLVKVFIFFSLAEETFDAFLNVPRLFSWHGQCESIKRANYALT